VFADKHGVTDNSFKDHKLSDFPNFLRRYETLRPNARTAALITWKPFRDSLFDATKGSRFLVDGDAQGYERADKEVARAATTLFANENPDIVFAYFGNVDMLGHGYGFHPKSYKYTNGIETVDTYIGEMLDALRQRQTYANEDWLIVVCTDHGGQGRDHGLGRDVPEIRSGFLLLHGPSVKPGRIDERTTNADVAATVLSHLGVELQPEWKLDGKPVGLK
jgi:predicted AlkP superfamily pyrophosphatase or phosphodiesterase